ncbi:probable cytochrome P450 9f2 [Contarinia nasturtii]|uniref:probable cytochrome P450 9f2 n=1 Tax=Contarinia nasturtii TaxID=265458 RepID=UPI0012D38226|nr:probable cytochrome P450 9f2 [Contarinia nasturtii]
MLSDLLFHILIGIVLYLFYKWATINNDYFVKRKILHLDSVFLVGNTFELFLMRSYPAKWLESVYYRFPKEKIIGFFDMSTPVYMLRDLDLIYKITIKDFDFFKNHWISFALKSDSFMGKSVVSLEDSKWNDMRSTLSPIFTSSKLRHMFELVVECADEMIEYLRENLQQNNSAQLNIKEVFSRCSSDIITSCAFGVKVNSFKCPKNDFYTFGKNMMNFTSAKSILRIILVRTLPNLMLALNIEYFSKDLRQFFKSMVLYIMADREKRQIYRPDMINTLIQMRNGTTRNNINENSNEKDVGFATVEESNFGKKQVQRIWNEHEIVAQSAFFYTANFETISTVMTFLAYELAVNWDIQQKLYEEIQATSDSLDGDRLTYDIIPKMKYFDQVVCETLRKWPTAVLTNRICSKDYDLELDGRRVTIERESFDPERFNDENKKNIKAGAYIPFGIGPRNCIGSRLALMEIKAVFFYLLLNFHIQPNENMEIPLKIHNSVAFWDIESTIDLELKPRV